MLQELGGKEWQTCSPFAGKKTNNFECFYTDTEVQYVQGGLLSSALNDCDFPRKHSAEPLMDSHTDDFSYSENWKSEFRPTKRTKRVAASGHLACPRIPPSFASSSEHPGKSWEDGIQVSVLVPSKPPPSVKLDVAVVPQKGWDQLFEMALKAASWRIATPDIQDASCSF